MLYSRPARPGAGAKGGQPAQTQAASGGVTLDHRVWTGHFEDTGKAEICTGQQILKLRLGSFASARVEHHVYVVNKPSRCELVRRIDMFGQNALDQHHSGGI